MIFAAKLPLFYNTIMETGGNPSEEFNFAEIENFLEKNSLTEKFLIETRQRSIEAGIKVLGLLRQHGLVSPALDAFLDSQDKDLPLDELYLAAGTLDEEVIERFGTDDSYNFLRELSIADTLTSAYLMYHDGSSEAIRAEVEGDLRITYKLSYDEYDKLSPILNELFDGAPSLQYDSVETYILLDKIQEANNKMVAIEQLKHDYNPIMALLFTDCIDEGLVPPAHDDLKELFTCIVNALHNEKVRCLPGETNIADRLRWTSVQSIASRMGIDPDTIDIVRSRLKQAYDL